MVDPVVLLTVDSLTAGHMGCLGYDRNTTPRLDELRRRGTLYTNAVAQSSHTRESMPSLFFSQYPSQLPILVQYRTIAKLSLRFYLTADLRLLGSTRIRIYPVHTSSIRDSTCSTILCHSHRIVL